MAKDGGRLDVKSKGDLVKVRNIFFVYNNYNNCNTC